MPEHTSIIHVGLLNYPGAQLSAIYGLTDLFVVCNRIASASEQADELPVFRVSHWSLTDKADHVEQSFTSHPSSTDGLTVLIIPPSLEINADTQASSILLNWIQHKHVTGSIICSICMGAVILAQTGLLDDREITTHWALKETFGTLFPNIQLATESLIVDGGDIITAGGVMAWSDLGLRIIERFTEPSIMLEVARFFLLDPCGRQQKFYSSFTPNLSHDDELVRKVQYWLQGHYNQAISLKIMASIATLSDRTFLRRFQKATGLNPTAYLQQLRVGKAREYLERSSMPFSQITWKVGYNDVGAFHKLFQKIVGLSPGEYRQRFRVEDRYDRALAGGDRPDPSR